MLERSIEHTTPPLVELQDDCPQLSDSFVMDVYRHLAHSVKAVKVSGMANAVGLLVVAAMVLSGCASQQPQGSSQRNYNRDLYECEREATFAGRDNKQQVFDNCMKARGYTPFSTDRREWPHTQ
jgi:hypothetical protein